MSAGSVRFDGLYWYETTDVLYGHATRPSRYYRFFADGAVALVSSMGSPEQVSKWMTRAHKACSVGNYRCYENSILMTFTFKHLDCDPVGGQIEISGTIKEEGLDLFSKELNSTGPVPGYDESEHFARFFETELCEGTGSP